MQKSKYKGATRTAARSRLTLYPTHHLLSPRPVSQYDRRRHSGHGRDHRPRGTQPVQDPGERRQGSLARTHTPSRPQPFKERKKISIANPLRSLAHHFFFFPFLRFFLKNLDFERDTSPAMTYRLLPPPRRLSGFVAMAQHGVPCISTTTTRVVPWCTPHRRVPL